jgi:hypothetical protein
LDTRIEYLLFSVLLFSLNAFAGESIDGKSYTNFGADLHVPIFPVNGVLNIYRNKGDLTPIATLKDMPVINQSGAVEPCAKVGKDDWAQCKVRDTRGWVKYSDFLTADEYKPVDTWPFRYWLYISSTGTGSEEAVTLRGIVRKNSYLVAPASYSNIFFHVLFDKEGRAISPKSHKPTGDRIFLAGSAIYLAPEDSKRRKHATWLFLNYYNEKLNAMCPGQTYDSCMSAVNSAPNWPGIRRMHEEPPKQYKQKDEEKWYGAGEVAFARHMDPILPLMYRIPDDVETSQDTNGMTREQIAKNREKLVCIADCNRPQ